jgi:6-phosphogluconolactonase
MIYVLSCETVENGGGIYGYDLTEKGELLQLAYFPCDRPMYAVKCEKGLCVLLRQPFEDNNFSGYFYVDENLQTATEMKSTQGVVACHLCVDDNDIYIVNYLSGNIVKNGETIAQRTGKSMHSTRQTEPHTHFVDKTPDGYLAVCDLGTDTLAIYDKALRLICESKVPSGYGIRHLVFSKDEKFIYAVNELVPSVSVFTYVNGKAELVDTVKIDCKNEKANGAAIRLSKNGKYLYVSLREENAICVFAVDDEKLTLLQKVDCGGNSPRDFDVCGDYLIVCNENSENVVVYRIANRLIINKVAEISIKRALCVVE